MSDDELRDQLTEKVRLYGRQHLATALPAPVAVDSDELKDEIRGISRRLADVQRQQEAAEAQPASHLDRLKAQMARVRESDKQGQQI